MPRLSPCLTKAVATDNAHRQIVEGPEMISASLIADHQPREVPKPTQRPVCHPTGPARWRLPGNAVALAQGKEDAVKGKAILDPSATASSGRKLADGQVGRMASHIASANRACHVLLGEATNCSPPPSIQILKRLLPPQAREVCESCSSCRQGGRVRISLRGFKKGWRK
jgi:hypothetical protein